MDVIIGGAIACAACGNVMQYRKVSRQDDKSTKPVIIREWYECMSSGCLEMGNHYSVPRQKLKPVA